MLLLLLQPGFKHKIRFYPLLHLQIMTCDLARKCLPAPFLGSTFVCFSYLSYIFKANLMFTAKYLGKGSKKILEFFNTLPTPPTPIMEKIKKSKGRWKKLKFA